MLSLPLVNLPEAARHQVPAGHGMTERVQETHLRITVYETRRVNAFRKRPGWMGDYHAERSILPAITNQYGLIALRGKDASLRVA